MILAMAIIHISEAEAARDFAGLMARVRKGAEVLIDNENSSPVSVRMAVEPRGRLLSESIALAEAHAKELGCEPVMDAEFAADVERRIGDCKPRDGAAWD